MENKIYKEAILDAKALRASAIANAKSMMQEAIEPAIQEMMRLKLSEELEEEIEETEELEETYDEGEIEEYGDEHPIATKQALGDEDEVTDATLEEILAELDAIKEDETLNEAEEDEDESEEEVEDEEAGEETEEAIDDETKVVDITLGDLKAALFPQMGGAEAGEEMEAGDETTPVSLDEILAELEEKEHGKVEELATIGGMPADQLIAGLAALFGTTIPLAASIYKNMKGKSAEEKKQVAAQMASGIEKATGGQMEEELEMANETINTLRESINEINLLNAKLLYMNKIFKAKNLTESQKVKVVKAFDRSASVKEVKNTYEVLKESIETKKSQLKESVGFASKPIGSVAKNNIIEADPFINRWQKIAGIK